MLKKLLPLFIVCCALLAGCGTTLPTIKPFKMDIQQGNVVTSKMLLQLKPGMTKSQVRFIMGTPLVVDSFHKDRWDYFYQMRQAGKIVEQRRVILDFEKELLTKVRGDVVPQGTAGADTGESNMISTPITIEPRPKEPSMLDKLKFWKKDENGIAKPDVVAPVVKAPAKIVVVTDTSKAELPPESLAASEATPSVLAVPIELPSIEQPSAEQHYAESTNAELPNDAPVVTEPEAKTALPITGKDSLKPFKSPSEKLLPAKPESLMPTPEKPNLPRSTFNKALAPKPTSPDSQLSRPLKPLPIPTNKDEKLIFRLDKNFDISRADEVKVETLPANTLPVDGMPKLNNQPKPQKADLDFLPPESEPSFFDRMLEKIGF